MGRIALLLLLFLPLPLSSSSADILYLKDGRRMRGVIIRETEKTVELLLYNQELSFGRDKIREIRRESGEENQALQESWGSYRKELERKHKEEVEQERSMAEKGYVKWGGRWVSREDIEAQKQEQPSSTALERENQLLRKRIRELTTEVSSLRRQVDEAQARRESLPLPEPAAPVEEDLRTRINRAISQKRVIKGMTTSEVRSTWGFPERTRPVQSPVGSKTTDTWTYYRESGPVYLHFEDDVLFSIRRRRRYPVVP